MVLVELVAMVMVVRFVLLVGRFAEPVRERNPALQPVAEPRVLRALAGELVQCTGADVQRPDLGAERRSGDRIPTPGPGLVLGLQPLAITRTLVRASGRHLDPTNQRKARTATIGEPVFGEQAHVANTRNTA